MGMADTEVKPSVLCARFQLPTEQQIALYDLDVLQLVRDENIDKL